MRYPGAGELNRPITLRVRSDFPATDMGLDSNYPSSIPTWAKIEPVGSVIYAGSVQVDNTVTHRVTLRYRTGITDSHEVVEGNTVYRVKRVTDMNGARRFTVLEVEELGQV